MKAFICRMGAKVKLILNNFLFFLFFMKLTDEQAGIFLF
jgi:hypothetical protein